MFASSLTLYDRENFMGRDKAVFSNLFRLDFPVHSLIVTGCDSWTLYSEAGFRGYAVCVFNADPTSCNAGFYPRTVYGGRRVGSIRRGCASSALSKPLPENSKV